MGVESLVEPPEQEGVTALWEPGLCPTCAEVSLIVQQKAQHLDFLFAVEVLSKDFCHKDCV